MYKIRQQWLETSRRGHHTQRMCSFTFSFVVVVVVNGKGGAAAAAGGAGGGGGGAAAAAGGGAGHLLHCITPHSSIVLQRVENF